LPDQILKFNKYIAILYLLTCGLFTWGQPLAGIDPVLDQEVKLPLVFQIGEYEASYEQLLTEYPNMLLTVCNNDMAVAYDKWIAFLMELEQKAEEENLDILGVKMWINVFWDQDGQVQHIAYHLKPNSKNVSTEKIGQLLARFAREHKMNIEATLPYSHYGSVAFPLFPRSVKR